MTLNESSVWFDFSFRNVTWWLSDRIRNEKWNGTSDEDKFGMGLPFRTVIGKGEYWKFLKAKMSIRNLQYRKMLKIMAVYKTASRWDFVETFPAYWRWHCFIMFNTRFHDRFTLIRPSIACSNKLITKLGFPGWKEYHENRLWRGGRLWPAISLADFLIIFCCCSSDLKKNTSRPKAD